MTASSLKERLSKLGQLADETTQQAIERIDELEDERNSVALQLRPGEGHLVNILIRASDEDFNAELDGGDDLELFDRLLPGLWPQCLLRMDAIEPTDAAELSSYIDDGDSDAESIARDIEKLERLKAMIEEALQGLKR
jgi:hypothetical protein